MNRNDKNIKANAIQPRTLVLRFYSFLIALAIVIISQPAISSESDNYDEYFQDHSLRYFGTVLDWKLFKAQGMVESRLRNKAKSHRGARGIMQIMPATYKEIQKKNKYFVEKQLSSAETNISAGIFFNAYLYDRWNNEVSAREISKRDRIRLMLASYNGGYVRVLRAYRKAEKPENDWEAVAQYLPKETRNYVDRVLHLMDAENARKVTPETSSQTQILASSETESAK